MKKKLSSKTQWEVFRGNLICTKLRFDGKGFVLSAAETELSLWVSFTGSSSKVAIGWQIRPLWTRVKIPRRVKSVISHLGIASYKYAAPAVICGCGLVRYFDPIGQEFPKKDSRNKTQRASTETKVPLNWADSKWLRWRFASLFYLEGLQSF